MKCGQTSVPIENVSDFSKSFENDMILGHTSVKFETRLPNLCQCSTVLKHVGLMLCLSFCFTVFFGD